MNDVIRYAGAAHTAAEWAALDLRHLWHPFTPMHSYDPVIFASAEGSIIRDINGKEYIDGFAGLWTMNVGHGRREIVEAAAQQMAELAYVSLFKMSNLPAIRLAEKLATLLPGDMNRVFLTLGGSESVDTAFKIARQYWVNQGRATKQKIISRRRAYHGTSLGATGAQGLLPNRIKFEPLPGFLHVDAPYPYQSHWSHDPEECSRFAAEELEREILFQGPETICAFIAESIIGTGGVIPPHPSYWPRVREICDKYEVLLIADEVITGFGRTGKLFAMDHWNVVPDLMTMAKGLSSGYAPIGAVGVRDTVYAAFHGAGREFNSGCTFDGHPVACAAALANLAILEREGLVERAAQMGEYMRQKLQQLYRHEVIGEIRTFGLVAGLEFVQDRATRAWFPPDRSVATRVQKRAFELGLYSRLLSGGDIIALAPPFVITEAEVDRMVAILDQAIAEVGSAT